MTKLITHSDPLEYFPVAYEKACIKRYQIYLDTGHHDSGKYSKTWDMLAWLAQYK